MRLTIKDKELISEAKKIIIKSKPVKLIGTGGTGAALMTSKGNIYQGFSMGFYCGISSCGEYQAMGNMISNGEKEIKTIVSVNKKGHIVSPCGHCREMMWQACRKNKNTEVMISKTKKIKLKELLPYQWGGSIERTSRKRKI